MWWRGGGCWHFLRESPSPVPKGRKSPPGLALPPSLDCGPQRPPSLRLPGRKEPIFRPRARGGGGSKRNCCHLLPPPLPVQSTQRGGGAGTRATVPSSAHPRHVVAVAVGDRQPAWGQALGSPEDVPTCLSLAGRGRVWVVPSWSDTGPQDSPSVQEVLLAESGLRKDPGADPHN